MRYLVGQASDRTSLFALCAFACLLLGCGQTAEAPTPQAAGEIAPPAPVEDNRPVIVAFGDSITAGAGVDETEAYPARLEALLAEAGFRYRVINEGISGDTTSAGRVRLSTITALSPEIVILELGGNDGLRGLPVENTRANLDEIVVALREAGISVVLVGMTLPPNYGPDYISRFEQLYSDLAQQHGLTLIPVLPDGVDPTSDLVQEDRIHPTPAGHRLLAERVMKALRPLLKARSGAP